jgi:uncharacterized protein (DUF4415 family)
MTDRPRPTERSTRRRRGAFKAATTKPAELPKAKPSIPLAKEQVTLRIDRDVLDHFQKDGPGWQDRIKRRAAEGRREIAIK